MAIVWMDGFEEYNGTNLLTSAAYVNAASSLYGYGHTGRFGGKALGLLSTAPVVRGFPATNAVAIGVAIKTLVTPSNLWLFNFRSATGGIICSLYVSSSGVLTFGRGSNYASNVLGTSAGGIITSNTWYYVEIEFTSHATAGSFNVYVNGALVLSGSGVNTDGAACYSAGIGSVGSGTTDIDDLYITNTAAHLGECRIETLVPNADTAQKDFTASTGSDNFAMVDELPVDGDTTYVEASTSGDSDLYTTAGLSSTPSSILAVQARVCAKKTDTGLRSLKAKIKSGATESASGTFALSTDYSMATLVCETDPNTSDAWAASDVNAASIGMELA